MQAACPLEKAEKNANSAASAAQVFGNSLSPWFESLRHAAKSVARRDRAGTRTSWRLNLVDGYDGAEHISTAVRDGK
jgi:hypothetical protein